MRKITFAIEIQRPGYIECFPIEAGDDEEARKLAELMCDPDDQVIVVERM